MDGEFEIEKIPTHMVESRPRYLVPAVNHFQEPKTQVTRYLKFGIMSKKTNIDNKTLHRVPRGNGSDPVYMMTDAADVSENGEDASQTPIEETNGVVNSDSCPISDTQTETVNNRDCSVSGTQSEPVNSNNNSKNKIGQKMEKQFEDEGDHVD